MSTAPTPDPLHNNYRYNGEDDDANWILLPEPTACEGHTHRYYNNEDKCVCGRGPDLSKRRMQ